MYQLVGNPRTLRITNKLATEFAMMEPVPEDRPIRERRIAVYRKTVEQGGFRPVSWAKAYVVENGTTHRVNGKHTSTLFMDMDLSTVQELFAVVEIYRCDTFADLSRLYATYDSKLQSRTTGDINRSFAASVPMLADMPYAVINCAVSGIAFGERQEQYSKTEPAERAEALLDHPDFVKWLYELVGSDNRYGYMRRVPVVGAMFMTYNKKPSDATRFWTAVRDETGISPELPDRKLSRFLLTHVQKKHDNRQRVRDREFFVKALHAWNAWRRNEPTNLRYQSNAPIPDVR